MSPVLSWSKDSGPNAITLSSRARRSSDLARAEDRLAAASDPHETAARPTMAASSRATGTRSWRRSRWRDERPRDHVGQQPRLGHHQRRR